MRVVATPTYLKTVPFAEILFWDTKRYTSLAVESSYPIVSLGTVITEQKKRYKLDEPEREYGILGVNNKEGIFDAYLEKGKKINQAYKKMEVGWIAYNPYRINVGSIGVRLENHTHEYISPAYVVFSCKEQLLPEYLFLLFKTDTFNRIIKENTTGSVRQNLKFDTLSQIKVPLPNITEQQRIVDAYKEKLNKVQQLELDSNKFEDEIESYFLKQLGLQPIKFLKKETGLLTTKFSKIERWDVFSVDARINLELSKSNYPIVSIGKSFHFIKRSWNKTRYKEDTFNYVEIGAINPITGITEAKKVATKKAPSRANQTIRTGDLIIGTTRPYLKKFAIVTPEFNNNVCSSGFSVIESNVTSYNLSFLLHFLQCAYGIEQLKNKMTGGLYPAITESELKEIKIPFPDVKKQNEIIELVENRKQNIVKNKNHAEQLKQAAIKEFEQNVFGE